MTSGSTGGWASFAGPSKPTNPNDPKGWGWVGPFVTGLAGAAGGPFGPLIAGGMGALGSLNDKVSGFQGTDKGFSNVWRVPLGAFGGYGLGALGSGVGGAISGGLKSGISGIGSGFGQGMSKYLGTNIIPGLGGSNPTAWFGGSNAIPTKYGSMMQPLYGGQPAITGTAALAGAGASNAVRGANMGANIANLLNAGKAPIEGGSAQGVDWLNKAWSGAKDTATNLLGKNPLLTAAGLGTSALGLLANGGKPTQVPRSDYWNEYTNRLLGDTPLKSAATTQAISLMNRPEPGFTPVSEEMYEAAVRRNKEEEINAEKNLRTEYKGVRPGADIESDSGFRQDVLKMRDKFAKERMALNYELAYNREKEYNSRIDDYYKTKSNYLTNILKLDNDMISQFSELAQNDQNWLMANAGLTAQQAQNFKDLFADLGSHMMKSGLGLTWNDYFNQAKAM
jgi:hypothetical protein